LSAINNIAFGPVPSRRLGRSLGINNIPAKHCSYSCIYCQLGRTPHMEVKRTNFYDPERIFEAVKRKVQAVRELGEDIDFLTFVPDGEPTLDSQLADEIHLLKKLGIPIAIITNSSLIWQDNVQSALKEVDLVSFKVDAVSDKLWRKIDRPHGSLHLNDILSALIEFTKEFSGRVITETMLVENVSHSDEAEKIAEFLSTLRLDKAYIAIPTRPPAERWVRPASEGVIHHFYQIFSEKLDSNKVEYLIGYEGNAFAHSGNPKEDLLSIMAVHPMRKEAVEKFIKEANSSWELIEVMLKEGLIIELQYKGHTYFMRKLESRVKSSAT